MSLAVRTEHYVYQHVSAGDVFYIGIGCSANYARAHSTKNRNAFWLNYTKCHPYDVVILREGLSKHEACEIETELIAHYGKRCVGTGTLVNLSDGGENSLFGVPRTKEHAKKIGDRNRGLKRSDEVRLKLRNAKLGKTLTAEHKAAISLKLRDLKRTDETKRRLSAAKRGVKRPKQTEIHKNRKRATAEKNHPFGIASKQIECANNGKRYGSAVAAARDLGISDKHIGSVCRGNRAQHLGFKFKYVE